MTRIKLRLSPTAVLMGCVLVGLGAVVAGVYLQAGLAVALIVGGGILAAIGLLVDL